mgnify:FL=1
MPWQREGGPSSIEKTEERLSFDIDKEEKGLPPQLRKKRGVPSSNNENGGGCPLALTKKERGYPLALTKRRRACLLPLTSKRVGYPCALTKRGRDSPLALTKRSESCPFTLTKRRRVALYYY